MHNLNLAQKELTVWYEGGAGGFFVGWLLNIASNATVLDAGLSVFPVELEKNSFRWRDFEKTPPEVGVLSNMFFLNPESNYKCLSKKESFDELVMSLQTKGQNTNDLMTVRSKFFLLNYILESANATFEKFSDVDYQKVKNTYPLDTFKYITDVIFNIEKNIFLIGHKEYTKIACYCKRLPFLDLGIDEILAGYVGIKTFKLESVWKNYWQSEIENILGRQLTFEQYDACNTFIKRYIQVMPGPLLEFCHAN